MRNIIENISTNLSLEKLNPNPFLIKLLNLNNAEDLIEFLLFQRVDRSIVTSLGTCLEFLVAASGAEKLPGGFDVVKTIDGIQHFIQVKSGTSDMDKDQVDTWRDKIVEVENEENRGYIGITYGKTTDENAISIGLFQKYLPNWEERTKIGLELWEFVSGQSDYHETVLENLENAANQVLHNNTIIEIIEETKRRIIEEFREAYGDEIENYINSRFH